MAVRSRRPASPPPLNGQHGFYAPPMATARFPGNKEDHMDADERIHQAKLEPRGALRRPLTHPVGGIKMTVGEWWLLGIIVLVAMGVRFYRLSKPDSVVFDEVHFGKFAGKYIKTRYYVDVHPPLAKLLITLAAFVGGYDGNFDFKEIGKVYENVPYVGMRALPAFLGVGLVPLSYLTLRALDCRATTATLGSLFITFENGLLTQSRLILLDSPLVFFTGLTTFLWVGFVNENRYKPFTEMWWLWLTLTGLSLGAVVSCKWVGLFTIATVGVATIRQLWLLLGDLKVSPRLWMKHFLARALCLILVPLLFYMAMFEIHFLILENSGDGDGFMSSEFQHTLGGRHMQDTYADVALGSTISIRHVNTQGGYLHSHQHNYPTGSKQQQITLYPHRDGNNDWRVLNVTKEGEHDFDWENNPLVYITDGMQLRFEHIATKKRLHSHDMRPPISEVDFQNEVSGYGFENFTGDANDYWTLEIYKGDKRDKESSGRLKTLKTHFRLKHVLSGCYLFSHKVKLPDWAYEQQEVTCNKQAPKANSLWYVETNTHPQLPLDAPKINYRLPGFLSKFLELQGVMWATNAGLTERHNFDSRPQDWPRLRRGINFWVKDHRQIYLIGNPWVWWLSTTAILLYAGVRGFMIVRAKRGYKDFNNSTIVKYDEICGFLFIGWGLHYFPFYLMARQLFLHHYFPALYFSILLFCAVFDFATGNLRRRVRVQIAAVFIIIAIINYAHFSPLAYGTPWTKAKCLSSRWVKTWDFACNDFLEDMSLYDKGAGPTTAKSAAVTTISEGRAPIVVQEPIKEPPPVKIDTTTVGRNQPVPGRDIFDQNPPKEVQSEPGDPEVEEPPQAGTTTTKNVQPIAQPPPPPPVLPVVEGTMQDSKGQLPAKDAPNADDGPAKVPMAEGPKGEAEAERERVGAGLFNDDA